MASSEKTKEIGSSTSPDTQARPGRRDEAELSEEELNKVSGGAKAPPGGGAKGVL
jgi:bacteriocin-like protein